MPKPSHTDCIDMASPQYEFSYEFEHHYFARNFATLVALIWSLPSMNSHMHLKTITLRDSFATLVALIWSLPSMNSHMHFKANHL